MLTLMVRCMLRLDVTEVPLVSACSEADDYISNLSYTLREDACH